MQIPANAMRGQTVYMSFSAEINVQTSESLIAAMANLANARTAEVRLLLSTPGGNVMNGMNVYNVLRGLPFKLVTHNVGNMDSIGNSIFQAGEERYACAHSTFMFHGVSLTYQGNGQLSTNQLRERLSAMEADELRIGSIIEQRTKLTQAQIGVFFAQGHTMNATEAVSLGVVDEIRDVQIPPGSPVVSLVFQR